MTDIANLTVGQKLWLVPFRGENQEVTVEKIGTKYATVSGYRAGSRIDKNTLYLDCSVGLGGRCYVSRVAYEHEAYRQKCWNVVQVRLLRAYSCPMEIYMTDIRRLATVLGLELPEPPERYREA